MMLRRRVLSSAASHFFGSPTALNPAPAWCLRVGISRSTQPIYPRFRCYSTGAAEIEPTSTSTPPPPPPPSFKNRSLFRRLIGFSTIAIFSFVLGSAANPRLQNMHSTIVEPTTDEESITKFTPPDEISREIEEFINTHPLAKSLREKTEFTEARPHLKIPVEMRAHNLTAGTLAGPNKIVVPPYVWSEEGGKSLIAMIYLGSDVCGHRGIVHGGMLATLLDETLARCCFPALPNKIGVTANLNIDYKSPASSEKYFVVRAETTKVEGRKAWVKGKIETLPEEGKEPTVVVEATALFIEPKNASMLPSLYKVT